jgi:hypothetical protein
MSVQKPLKCSKVDYVDDTVDSKLWSLFDLLPVMSNSASCKPNVIRYVPECTRDQLCFSKIWNRRGGRLERHLLKFR